MTPKFRMPMLPWSQAANLRKDVLKTAIAAAGQLFVFCLLIARQASGQVAPASTGGDEAIFAGIDATALHLQYGSETVLGYRAFVDANLNVHWGIEGAATWTRFRERNSVHADEYLAGPRYILPHWKRTTVAFKGLVGGAKFYFPYGFAQGSYFVLSPGIDVSYRINRFVRWQVINAEYQYWPEFTYGAMQSETLDTGLSFRLY